MVEGKHLSPIGIAQIQLIKDRMSGMATLIPGPKKKIKQI